jgi:hypothetical protein
VNRLDRSYATQGDRKIRDVPPLPPATAVQWRSRRVPGPASTPVGRSGPHTANQNEGDLYRYDNETDKEGHMGLTVSDFFLLIQAFMVEIHTL